VVVVLGGEQVVVLVGGWGGADLVGVQVGSSIKAGPGGAAEDVLSPHPKIRPRTPPTPTRHLHQPPLTQQQPGFAAHFVAAAAAAGVVFIRVSTRGIRVARKREGAVAVALGVVRVWGVGR